MNFTEGYVKLARKIQESEIWYKPPEYLKIFEYFLFNVNYEDNGTFKAGEQYFNISQIRIPRVTESQIRHFLRWACSESVNMFAKRKTTRGIILKLNNYELYQDYVNYKFQKNLPNSLTNNCQQTANQLPNSCQTINNKQRNKEINNNKNNIIENYKKFKNVYLTDEQYRKLSVEFMSEKRLLNLIEELSDQIAIGKEKPFSEELPELHFTRLRQYYRYQLTHNKPTYKEKNNGNKQNDNTDELPPYCPN